MKKRIFITGGEGFIGSSLIDKLVELGHETASYDAKLNFIDNEAYHRRSRELRKKHLKHQPSKKYIGDIRNFDLLKRKITDFKPDVLVHLAGLPMARFADKYQNDQLTINMHGTLNVFEAFEKSKAERIVYTSSSMAYGHFKQTPQTESFILDPSNSYGAAKAAGEYFVKLSQKDWVIVRPTSVYGFTDCANRVSQILMDAAYNNRNAWTVEGETLDFSYIDDVAEGFVLCTLKKQAVRNTFNISRGEARSTVEFGKILQEYFPNFKFDIRKPTKQQVWRGPLDISKARSILNFEPKYSIEEGIRKTLDLVDEYGFYKIK